MDGEPIRQRTVAERYEELRQRHEELERGRQQAWGALSELRKRVASEFGVTSDREVRALQNKLDAEVAKLEEEFWEKEQALQKWDEKLNEG